MTPAFRHTAALLTAALPLTAAHATTQFAYAAGTGVNTSSLVVDFAESGGDAFVFDYRYDGEQTGLDLLQAVDEAGALELFTTTFSFGVAVDGFAFGDQSQNIGFDAVGGRFWSYYTDGGFEDRDFDGTFSLDEAVAAGSFGIDAAPVGPGSRLLSDGSVDGWVVNVSEFNSSGAFATNRIPASVPEPASLALIGVGLLAITRRRTR